jgi:exosortase
MGRRLGYSFVSIIGLAALSWAYWPTVRELAERWAEDPQYSHGFLVPLFSAFLLWHRRREIASLKLSPSWWGIAFAGAGLGLWILGTRFFFAWFSEISILICIAGLVLTVGGWRALRWSWQAILFLGFMVPLPYRIQTVLGGRLQQTATVVSTYAIQTLGAPAIREGNVILINDVKIGVVEACNGLGMLVTFFAISTGMAMLMRSSQTWVRAIVIVSAAPVAILSNVARITVTGLLFNANQNHLARVAFHDIAGLMMMPLAIAILFLELHVLKRLVVERPANDLESKGFNSNRAAIARVPAAR